MSHAGSGYNMAVMAERRSAPDALDFFPTPPWATRALCEHVLVPYDYRRQSVWEPAAGEGHMAEVLAEYFARVSASDVHDYGKGYDVGSFVGLGPDVAFNRHLEKPTWIITNPPFNLAVEFAERALVESADGVALLVRTAWLESKDRYERLFAKRPPCVVALFAERVPMVKGRWDPNASTATSYAWVVWRKLAVYETTRLMWIPPGCRAALTRPYDIAKFARLEGAKNEAGNSEAEKARS